MPLSIAKVVVRASQPRRREPDVERRARDGAVDRRDTALCSHLAPSVDDEGRRLDVARVPGLVEHLEIDCRGALRGQLADGQR